MFENERWDAQIAVDWSGEYTEINDAVGGLSQIAEPITWVTASVAFAITPSFTVSLEGRNLTDEHYLATLGRPDILAGFETWGRFLLLGVTAKL
jgi:iron complex outermembrane receptor protein